MAQEFDAAGRELWLKGRPAARFILLPKDQSIPLKTWRNLLLRTKCLIINTCSRCSGFFRGKGRQD
jgi:hypothetical protein